LCGIYPRGTLDIGREWSSVVGGAYVGAVPFLDIRVGWGGNQLRVGPYDKRLNTKYDLTPQRKFTPPNSLIWERTKSGALTAELHRLREASDTPAIYAVEVGLRIHELYRRGYSWGHLVTLLRRYMASHPQLYPQRLNKGNEHTVELIYDSFSYFYDNGAPELEERDSRIGADPPLTRPTPPQYRPNASLPEQRLQMAPNQSWLRA